MQRTPYQQSFKTSSMQLVRISFNYFSRETEKKSTFDEFDRIIVLYTVT